MEKRATVESSARLNIGNFVSDNLQKIKEKENYSLNFNEKKFVEIFVQYINTGTTIRVKAKGTLQELENKIKITYSLSNLGRGYIFWFVCNHCNLKSRFLYCPPNSNRILCRLCHRLAYKKQNTRNKEVAMLIKNPQLISKFIESKSLKHQLIALKAYYLREAIEREAMQDLEKYKGITR